MSRIANDKTMHTFTVTNVDTLNGRDAAMNRLPATRATTIKNIMIKPTFE